MAALKEENPHCGGGAITLSGKCVGELGSVHGSHSICCSFVRRYIEQGIDYLAGHIDKIRIVRWK